MQRVWNTLSFRKRNKPPKNPPAIEIQKPLEWQEDERKVREGTCSFQVKYLGYLEVLDSRGMLVCEEAIKALLKKKKKRTPRAILTITGDALRLVDETSKGLIVDQTIEKVSFCAPDRNHAKGFAYICRDGASRRWLCHGFMAVKETGERLSHAVGCAFGICLEKKQQREKEAVEVTFNENKTSFTRMGSFRPATLTERLVDPQSIIVAEPVVGGGSSSSRISPALQVIDEVASPTSTTGNHTAALNPSPALSSNRSPVFGANAGDHTAGSIPRPRASLNLLEKQGSLRLFPKLQDTNSPFKRDLSLRLTNSPTHMQRLTPTMKSGNVDVHAPTSASSSAQQPVAASTVLVDLLPQPSWSTPHKPAQSSSSFDPFTAAPLSPAAFAVASTSKMPPTSTNSAISGTTATIPAWQIDPLNPPIQPNTASPLQASWGTSTPKQAMTSWSSQGPTPMATFHSSSTYSSPFWSAAQSTTSAVVSSSSGVSSGSGGKNPFSTSATFANPFHSSGASPPIGVAGRL